jgi:predicted RND superfamily exporter protein
MAKIQEEFSGIEQFVVVCKLLDRAVLADPRLFDVMDDYERYIERDPAVARCFSMADLLGVAGVGLNNSNPKWAMLPTNEVETRAILGPLFGGGAPEQYSWLITPIQDATQVTVYCKNREGENVQRIVLRTQEFFGKPEHKVSGANFVLGASIIGNLAAANQEIIDNDLLLNVLAFSVIYVIVLITYRSFAAGLYLLFPLALANGAINAYMGAHDIGINVNTLPVVTVGVGFGIDYAIYVVSRIIEELALGAQIEKATYKAMVTSGKAVTFTALTLVASVLF